MQKLNGFILLHRKILDWEWYGNANVMRVFIHLLLLASFKQTRWQGIEVKPGQVITSYGHLAESLGLGVHSVRNALEKLKKTGEITVKTTNKYIAVTINNWDIYQSGEDTRATNGQSMGNQTSINGQHRNNVKNVNNVNKYTRTQTKAKTPSAKPTIFDGGHYDYEEIRRKARERIRERVQAFEEGA